MRNIINRANRIAIGLRQPYLGFIATAVACLLLCSQLARPVESASGDLDLSFGSGGRVTTDFLSGADVAYDLVLQPDGRIVAAGYDSEPGQSNFALARYNIDGSLDASFGAGGKVITDFFGENDQANSLALQQDGKIVAAGSANRVHTGFDLVFALARYNPDGSLDPGFGTGGKVTTDFAGPYLDMVGVAIQPDDKIVVAGFAQSSSTTTSWDFALARYNPDGSLDASFGVGGKVTTDFFGNSDMLEDLALQPDGKILVTGLVFTGHFFGALARYNSDGSLDAGFGVGGKVTILNPTGTIFVRSLALEPGGKIIVSGLVNYTGGVNDFAVVRLNGNGSVDLTFGTGGITTTDIRADDQTDAVIVGPGGKIVVAGYTSEGSVVDRDFALARYNIDGSLDASFGAGGKVVTNFFGGPDGVRALAIQSDGKIIAAGHTFNTDNGTTDFALARYDDGQPCVITCPANIIRSADPGRCGSFVSFDIGGSPGCGAVNCTPASGSFFPVGVTTVNCVSVSGARCAFTVSIHDSEASRITDIAVDKPVLWPPNHRMVDVAVNYRVTDNCVAGGCVLKVRSNEPISGPGYGNTAPDWEVLDARRVRLRAERAGNGSGRLYTITITCSDGAGNLSSRDVSVTVPTGQGK